MWNHSHWVDSGRRTSLHSLFSFHEHHELSLLPSLSFCSSDLQILFKGLLWTNRWITSFSMFFVRIYYKNIYCLILNYFKNINEYYVFNTEYFLSTHPCQRTEDICNELREVTHLGSNPLLVKRIYQFHNSLTWPVKSSSCPEINTFVVSNLHRDSYIDSFQQ